MEHKIILAANLREGLRLIKALYKRLLADNPLWEQWAYLRMHEAGMEWPNHEAVDNNFAWKSRKLLRRIKGA